MSMSLSSCFVLGLGFFLSPGSRAHIVLFVLLDYNFSFLETWTQTHKAKQQAGRGGEGGIQKHLEANGLISVALHLLTTPPPPPPSLLHYTTTRVPPRCSDGDVLLCHNIIVHLLPAKNTFSTNGHMDTTSCPEP